MSEDGRAKENKLSGHQSTAGSAQEIEVGGAGSADVD